MTIFPARSLLLIVSFCTCVSQANGTPELDAPATPRLVVCVLGQEKSEGTVLDAMKSTLVKFSEKLARSVEFGCNAKTEATVILTEHPTPPGAADALGAIRVVQGRPVGYIVIYRRSFRELYRPLTEDETGRAYGAVVYHELQHFIAQDLTHSESGLCAAFVTLDDLLGVDPAEGTIKADRPQDRKEETND